MGKHWIFILQVLALILFLRISAVLAIVGGLLVVLAYQPILFREKLTNGTTGEKLFVLVMILGWAYVIFKILEAKQLI